LTIEDALRLREARPTEAIDYEPIDGSRELKSLDHRLTALEREWFTEEKLRFEINAIPARWRIDYVEELLAAHGVRPKYVPSVEMHLGGWSRGTTRRRSGSAWRTR
jgi:hypothetical protein